MFGPTWMKSAPGCICRQKMIERNLSSSLGALRQWGRVTSPIGVVAAASERIRAFKLPWTSVTLKRSRKCEQKFSPNFPTIFPRVAWKQRFPSVTKWMQVCNSPHSNLFPQRKACQRRKSFSVCCYCCSCRWMLNVIVAQCVCRLLWTCVLWILKRSCQAERAGALRECAKIDCVKISRRKIWL